MSNFIKSLFVSGAKNIIYSVNRIQNGIASIIVKKFYEFYFMTVNINSLIGRYTIAESLRNSIISLIKNDQMRIVRTYADDSTNKNKEFEEAINNLNFNPIKEKILKQLPEYIDEYIINTHPKYSLPNLVSISVKYIEGESVMLMLDDEGIAVSTRSACATGSLRASHVLMSLGLDHADAQGTLVISFGIDNTKEDVDKFLTALKNVVTTLRDISPLYNKISNAK